MDTSESKLNADSDPVEAEGYSLSCDCLSDPSTKTAVRAPLVFIRVHSWLNRTAATENPNHNL